MTRAISFAVMQSRVQPRRIFAVTGIGAQALTTRGMVEEDMREIGEVVSIALSDRFDSERETLAERSRALTERYPLYPQLSAVTAA